MAKPAYLDEVVFHPAPDRHDYPTNPNRQAGDEGNPSPLVTVLLAGLVLLALGFIVCVAAIAWAVI